MTRAGEEQPGGSWLHFYAEELRTTREARGMSQRGLASHTTYSYQQVCNVEAARRTPSQSFSREVDVALETGDRFQRILRRVLDDPFPEWFKGAAKEEQRADRIRIYEAQVIPGLFQNEEYTRAQMNWGQPRMPAERLEIEVAGRLKRQELLTRENPPFVWVILDESALLRPIGGRGVMTGQLQRLLREAESPNIVIQIVRLRTDNHPGLDGSFTIWSYEDHEDVVYAEGMMTGGIIERRQDVASANLSYDLLQAVALDPGMSLDFIRSVLKDEYSA
ncbi:Helix-turn-helix domain-containing protein [Streptomyces sp. DvalAA-14]|uniref:helix-turn-helix domain-containing protein n=1 Tax=unclassified Streptomyces TaxID=2593676 RepID=UPI00081B3459|nr:MULTISPECIES: helix-turn-helix transcriptional regulator [unclassified Streptomyces]MYS23378.1 helix-turn-helix domain-containing protein [Streptomyces sp. SID4948]SCE32395.1 Helix-turn-helix domain-containing protein [Streptomyces sp. DvalAA-14]